MAVLELPNTNVTPHIAYNTCEAIRHIDGITLENIRCLLRERDSCR